MGVTEKIKVTRKRPRRPPRSEQVLWMKGKLSRWTTLQPDFAILDTDEQWALHELVVKASAVDDPHVDGFNPDKLGARDRQKLERLIERASGQPGAFKESRELDEVRREAAAIVRETRRSSPTREQEGAFFAEVRKQLSHPNGTCLRSEHLAVLTGLLAVMFSADPPVGSDLRVERGAGGETELGWRRGYSLFGVADSHRIASRSEQIVQHLAKNRWFELSGGAEMTIRLGPRAKKVFGGGKR